MPPAINPKTTIPKTMIPGPGVTIETSPGTDNSLILGKTAGVSVKKEVKKTKGTKKNLNFFG
jgi:hypothetical protein